jgi:hypothetical protein
MLTVIDVDYARMLPVELDDVFVECAVHAGRSGVHCPRKTAFLLDEVSPRSLIFKPRTMIA